MIEKQSSDGSPLTDWTWVSSTRAVYACCTLASPLHDYFSSCMLYCGPDSIAGGLMRPTKRISAE